MNAWVRHTENAGKSDLGEEATELKYGLGAWESWVPAARQRQGHPQSAENACASRPRTRTLWVPIHELWSGSGAVREPVAAPARRTLPSAAEKWKVGRRECSERGEPKPQPSQASASARNSGRHGRGSLWP